MMSNTSRWLIVFSMVVAGIVYGTAQAKEPETVTSRDRPEVDALGMMVGDFWLFPALGVETYHNDNIFATNVREESDSILRIKPELDLESNWNRHMLNLTASADIGRYRDNDSEDFEDYRISIDGRLDVQGEDTLTGKVGYARKHVLRSSPNDQNGKEPTTYDVGSASTAYRKRFNRFSFRVGAEFERRDYNDVKSPLGKKINNDDQDRDELEGLVQLNYDISPQYSVFLRTRYNTIDYDDTFDSRGLQRSSDGYKIVVGTELRLTGLLYGEVFAGYGKRNYDDSTLKNIDEPTGGVSLTWLPTQLTTVTFSVERYVSETVVSATSGILSTKGAVVVDHELLRSLLLQARLSTSEDDFEGINRNDTYVGAGFGANYLMNRHLYLSLNYDYLDRDSDVPTGRQDFTSNVIWLGIRGQL
jgi:hypothetical protein